MAEMTEELETLRHEHREASDQAKINKEKYDKLRKELEDPKRLAEEEKLLNSRDQGPNLQTVSVAPSVTDSEAGAGSAPPPPITEGLAAGLGSVGPNGTVSGAGIGLKHSTTKYQFCL